MQPLNSYLTKEGWRKDWNQTIDHILQSNCSPSRLAYSALAQSLVAFGGVLGSSVEPAAFPLGLISTTGALLHLEAALRQHREEAKEGIEYALQRLYFKLMRRT